MRSWWVPISRWLLLVLAALAFGAQAAALLTGNPPTLRIVPETDGSQQNFAVVQDARGIVYVANFNGVLEYDGEHWSLIPLDNREMVRSLAVAGDGRVYVGGYNAMGYLQADEHGRTRYVDLTPRFAKYTAGSEFADIWDTLVTPDGVYFRALRDVFFWDPRSERTLHWQHAGRFGAIGHYQNQTLLQFRGEGFRMRQGDAWVAMAGTEKLVNLIYSLVPVADGGLLTTGVDGDWWKLLDGPPHQVTMPATLPAASNFDHALGLADGSIALASHEGSVYIVDPSLKAERHFLLDAGYLTSIHASADGGFIVVGDQAIYHVGWPSNWSMVGSEHGATGSLEWLARWGEADYLISSAGIFRVTARQGAAPELQRQDWEVQLPHDLIGLDEQRALLADNYHLLLLERGQTRRLSSELVYPRRFFRSRFRTQRVYVATENGLRFVDDHAGQLRVSEAAAAAAEMTVNSLVERSATELWFGTERHGVWQVTLDGAGQMLTQRRWRDTDGLNTGVVARAMIAQLANGELVASTPSGFYTLHGERFIASDLYGLAALRHPEELLTLAPAKGEELWAYSGRRLFHHAPGDAWHEAPLRQLLRGELLAHDIHPNGQLRFVASQSLLLHEGSDLHATAPTPQVLLRSVTQVMPDGSKHELPLYPAQTQALQSGDYAIQFQFALPDLPSAGQHAYQARLIGYEESYSDWARTRGFSYSRLRPGSYTLQVRARDSAGRISEIKPFELIILPPWYASWGALALWIVLGMSAAAWLVQRWIRHRLAKVDAQTQRLEAMIAERTRDLASANARLQAMAHLDGLTGISNRRRLDHYLDTLWAEPGSVARTVSLLAIDVDHFKRYNDSFGHLAGDQMLQDLVSILLPCLTGTDDLLARFGGEEFVAVLPDADAAHAAAVAESMRSAVAASRCGATISIGIAERLAGRGSVKDLFDAADQALYAAKRQGRNRVVAESAA